MIPSASMPLDVFEFGMSPSGTVVNVLLVFYAEEIACDPPLAPPMKAQLWRVRQFSIEEQNDAREFAKLHRTQVVASRVDVPRFAIEGWTTPPPGKRGR